jgi:hypothetical protein
MSESEEEQLRREMALLRKLKQGRITQQQFDEHVPDPLSSA